MVMTTLVYWCAVKQPINLSIYQCRLVKLTQNHVHVRTTIDGIQCFCCWQCQHHCRGIARVGRVRVAEMYSRTRCLDPAQCWAVLANIIMLLQLKSSDRAPNTTRRFLGVQWKRLNYTLLRSVVFHFHYFFHTCGSRQFRVLHCRSCHFSPSRQSAPTNHSAQLVRYHPSQKLFPYLV